ncbi:MAG: GDP-mannose 4,6-dehydratase [Myxococcota bacterium]
MRVFVTGASGFVGRRLLPRLGEAGHEALGADRETDVTNPAAIGAALREHRPDAIIHLAAMSSVAQSWQDPELCFHLNFTGTRSLLSALDAECPEARLLLIGSADQYVATAPQDRPMDESTPLRPRSPYARTKAAAELLGQRAAERGRDIIRIRAFNHTGAGQSDAFVASSFARQVAAIAAGRQAPVLRVGNLESVRDFLHVDDVIRAYLALLDPAVPADVYHVAGEQATPIQVVLDRLLEIGGVEAQVESDPERFRPTDWLVGDASRLRARTDWKPTISLDAILEELYRDWSNRDA